MTRTAIRISAFVASAALLAGCASDNTPTLATASVGQQPTTMAAKIDPACATLSAQIDNLKSEGIVDRVEKASSGKGATVPVKRASLAKQTELNKAYADFAAKCGPQIPRAQTAAVPAVPPAAQAAATQAATTAAAKVAPQAAAAVTPSPADAAAAAAKAAVAPKN
jgi:hypothetical protein